MAGYSDYTAAAILYNVQILPETLMTGLIILAIVLANGPLVFLAAGTALTQLLTRVVGNLIMKYQPDAATITSSMDMCSTGFIGKSWDRLLRGGSSPEQLWHPLSPSIYMATVGFLAGWGGALQQLYRDEAKAGVLSRSSFTVLSVVMGLLLLLTLLFRVFSGCETLVGAGGGMLLGVALGYFGAIALGYATDRRATNIWGIPLLRDRINAGSAVYVCGADVSA
jgi:hypothetical protein